MLTITHEFSVIETVLAGPALSGAGGCDWISMFSSFCRCVTALERLTVFGSAHVAGPEYTVTEADAGPPVGLPAGTGKATGLAKAMAARVVMLVRTERNCMLN
jgi:hypothetical protein